MLSAFELTSQIISLAEHIYGAVEGTQINRYKSQQLATRVRSTVEILQTLQQTGSAAELNTEKLIRLKEVMDDALAYIEKFNQNIFLKRNHVGFC